MSQYNIFVDTNVIIGAYANRQVDKDCLRYLYSLEGKRLYISALSIAQFVSTFQKKTDNKKLKEHVRQLLHRFTVVSFTEQDIKDALSVAGDNHDIEDNIQYVICKKVKCPQIITNNIKDYKHYNDMASVKSSSEVRTILR